MGPRYLVAILPTLALGWADVIGQIRNSPLWIFGVVSLGIYAFVLNPRGQPLAPLRSHQHQPSDAEVLLPLWDIGVEPYGLLRSAFSVDAMHFVVLLCVVGGASSVIRNIEVTPLCLVAAIGAVVGGIALVYATTFLEPHPQAKRNLAYIERSWEPRPGDHTRTKSKPLPPLTEAQKRAKPPRRRP